MFKYFLFLTFISRWNRYIVINMELCQFFVWRSCDNAEGRKKSTYSLSPHPQVARLLQIQSVEKICKKFVTHKINLDNCLGKSIHNYQKKQNLGCRPVLLGGLFHWLDGRFKEPFHIHRSQYCQVR